MAPHEPSTSPVAHLLRGRRTINDFRPDLPSQETLLQAIELARWAPNHKLTEPWLFHLIGPQTKQAIVELNAKLTLEAKGEAAAEKKRQRWSQVPGWLAVSCAQSEDPLRAQEDYAACCCAVQNLSLFLWSEGIGTKWSTGGVTRHPEFYRLLEVDPQQRSIVGLIWYGYPVHIPEMRRRDVSDIAVQLP